MSESWNDASESSSVRMERELLEASADNLAASVDNDSPALVNNDSTTTHHSLTLELFDSEILRMSRDADQILDSIRQEVAQSSSSSRANNRNSSTVRSTETTTTTFQTTEARLNSVTPIPPLSPAAADDEDDDMMDEEERLDAVTEVIRQSLSVDAADDTGIAPTNDVTVVTTAGTRSTDAKKQAKHPNNSSKENRKEKQLGLDDKSQQTTKTGGSLPNVTCAASHPEPTKAATDNKAATANARNGSSSAPSVATAKDAELKSSSSKSLLEQTNDKVQAMVDRNESYLVLMVTFVWALVLLLLVQARYQMLDANGVIRLPIFGR
jgi:hypothetical protein